jgi:hypothetical protein
LATKVESPSNPYTAPLSDAIGHRTQVKPEVSGWLAIAKPIFIRWELLRLLYNAILILETLVLFRSMTVDIRPIDFWVEAMLAGMVANVCYFAGPLINIYLSWLLEQKTAMLTWAIWGLGTVFSVGVTLLAFLSLR